MKSNEPPVEESDMSSYIKQMRKHIRKAIKDGKIVQVENGEDYTIEKSLREKLRGKDMAMHVYERKSM